MTPTELTQQIALELAGHAPAEFVFQPESLLLLVGLLQLVARHPQLPAREHDFIRGVISRARLYFADCPTILDLIARGDDASEDVPWERPS